MHSISVHSQGWIVQEPFQKIKGKSTAKFPFQLLIPIKIDFAWNLVQKIKQFKIEWVYSR